MKKPVKGFISAVVAAAMIISLPQIGAVNTNAAPEGKEPLTTIISWSDYQYESTTAYDKYPELEKQLGEILDGAAGAGFDKADYLLFGGDYTTADNGSNFDTATKRGNEGVQSMMKVVDERFPNLTDDTKLILQGNHDMANIDTLDPIGPIETDNFIVYMIPEDNYPSNQGANKNGGRSKEIVQETADGLADYLDTLVEKKETRPVLIASHAGLHYDIDRMDGNNQYAYILFDAINERANDLDIIFFFGHNHTNGDEQVGGSITYFEKGEELAVCHEDSIANRKGTNTEINFVYMNYGYVGVVGNITNNKPVEGHDPTNILVLTRLAIYDDCITIDRFGKNGLEDKYSVVYEREHAPKVVPTEAPTQAPEPTKAPDTIQAQPTAAPSLAPLVTDADKSPVSKAKIAIVGKKTVKVGKTVSYKAKLTNVKGKVKWSVNKKKLAAISKAGKLKAKKKGSVKITAKCGNVKATIKVKIK